MIAGRSRSQGEIERGVDRVFLRSDSSAYETFAFDHQVCAVFDDMVTRSVPQYAVIQRLLAELSLGFVGDGRVVDVGCSTGNTLENLISRAQRPLRYLGIDASEHMLEQCRDKFGSLQSDHEIEFELADVNSLTRLSKPDVRVVLVVLVLQFIRPLLRPKLLRVLHDSLEPGGCLLLVEKTIQNQTALNSKFISLYHAYKREVGYTEGEIARKREALENRLIPCFPEENENMLRGAGFGTVSTFFQWLNFQGYIAIKDANT